MADPDFVTEGQINALVTALASAHNTASGASAGDIKTSIRTTAETGWLKLDGSTVVGASTAHPDLWAVVPLSWQSGSDLVLPDMTSKVLAGGGTLGGTDGANTVTLAEANLPFHSHSMSHGHSDTFTTGSDSHNHSYNMRAVRSGLGTSSTQIAASTTSGNTTGSDSHNHSISGSVSSYFGSTGNAGSGTAVNIEQAALRVNYFVKT